MAELLFLVVTDPASGEEERAGIIRLDPVLKAGAAGIVAGGKCVISGGRRTGSIHLRCAIGDGQVRGRRIVAHRAGGVRGQQESGKAEAKQEKQGFLGK